MSNRRFFVIGVLSLVLAGCSQGQGSGTPVPELSVSPSPLATLTASPSPLGTDPIAAKAKSIVDSFTRSHPWVAAAFLTTTYAAYSGSRPDTAGIQGTPSPSDAVILVEIEGLFAKPGSCPFMMGTCYVTGIFVAYDQTLDQTLEVTYEDDPWSRDRPSPGPSFSERFAFLRRFGTPVTLQPPS
jgi:hypothetical protein